MTAESEHPWVLETRGVAKAYAMGRSRIQALQRIDLQVAKGETVCLMGRSGSGKTTLLNILGLIEPPDAGEVHLLGRAVHSLSERQKSDLRARHMGYVFQTFNLIPVLSAWENVEYPMLLVGTPPSKRKARVASLLEAVGLLGHRDHRPDELSGGQRQRVALARALANNPALVLADELTSALDRTTSIEIMNLIGDLNRRNGTTFLFSSHDEIVAEHSSRVISISDGLVAAKEEP